MGRFIVGITVGNLFLQWCASGAVELISNHISEDIPPQIKILNVVIHILLLFCSLISNLSVAIGIKRHDIQRNVT